MISTYTYTFPTTQPITDVTSNDIICNGGINPYHQPYQGPMYPIPGASSSSAHHAPVPANAYEYDVGILAQQSVYVPGAMIDKRGGAGGKLAKGGKRTTVLRKGAGKVWEDQTLLEWDPCKCRYTLPPA